MSAKSKNLKINILKKKMCHGKVSFKSMKDARRSCRSMKHCGGGVYEIYRCPFCDDWHIGHKSKTANIIAEKIRENKSEEDHARI